MADNFDKETILTPLTELGQRLDDQGLSMHIYLVGGAAMALTYDNRRVTCDIDAIFDESRVEFSIIQEMAVEHGLPEHWLNTAARTYLPGDDRLAPVLEIAGLTISTASPRHMLAMKMAAFRTQDQGDLRLLFDVNGISNPEEAVDIVFSVYGPDYATMFGSREDYVLRAGSILAQNETLKGNQTSIAGPIPDDRSDSSIIP